MTKIYESLPGKACKLGTLVILVRVQGETLLDNEIYSDVQ